MVSSYQADGKSPLLGWRDPSLKMQRKIIIKKTLICFALITLSMFTLLPIYFGAYYRQPENAYRLNVIILDLDSAAATLSSSTLSPSVDTGSYTAVLGPAVVEASKSYAASKGGSNVNATTWALGYVYPSAEEIAQFSLPLKDSTGTVVYTQGLNASEWCDEKVQNQDVWGCVVIHGNATMQAWNAISGGLTTYDPNGAIHFAYEEARNFYSSTQYVSSQVIDMISTATQQANEQFVGTVLEQAASGVGGGTSYLSVASPEALTGTFWYSSYNIRPFDQLAAEASTTAASIYLVIFTFFISLQWSQFMATLRPRLSLGSEIALKLLPQLAGYFWISLMYSFVPMAFGVTFNRWYGHIGFFLYWMLNWVTMTGLGMVMEFMLEVLTLAYFPFFLAFWVIINVSPAFADVADLDHFYSYAFILPVWNEIDATKSLVFGTKDHLLQNFTVNLAWAIGGAFALMLLVYARRARAGMKAFAEEMERLRKEE